MVAHNNEDGMLANEVQLARFAATASQMTASTVPPSMPQQLGNLDCPTSIPSSALGSQGTRMFSLCC